MKVTLNWPEKVAPKSEINSEFLQGMLNRTAIGYHRYGPIEEDIKKGMQPLKNVRERMRRYRLDGNTSWLMDAANYLMYEFAHPSHKHAHFDAETKSHGQYVKGKMKREHCKERLK